MNGDGRVTTEDWSGLVNCLTGPCGNPPCEPALYEDPCCRLGDFDTDGALDLTDFAAFQGKAGG